MEVEAPEGVGALGLHLAPVLVGSEESRPKATVGNENKPVLRRLCGELPESLSSGIREDLLGREVLRSGESVSVVGVSYRDDRVEIDPGGRDDVPEV
ncbi:hypothetical protein GCM10010102_43650 [Promicromonospora citrea]|uniref:Uncharacterized protein n=1 Tax=Promicromonospora citrea TaxID=43677 RepID=A0A8H9GT75_9MICO|nr:hypothetical protein GCM10010102_43650 [Promicromonospora citrea]